MSMFSDAFTGAVNSLPKVDAGAFGQVTANPLNVFGLGLPVVQIPKPLTKEEQDQVNQVQAKIELDPLDYAYWAYKKEAETFDKDPSHYKGTPTAELAAANAQRIATRNAEASAQRNYKLGRMRLDKSADSLRLATESSLANQEQLNYNDAEAEYKHYLSQLDERNAAASSAHQRGVEKWRGIVDPAYASRESTKWVPTAIQAIGGAVTGGGSSALQQALVSGAITGGGMALENNAPYFKEKLGTRLDLNPIPLTQAQWTSKKLKSQTGKE